MNGLNILVSNEPNAQKADMEDGTTKQIENSEPKKTVAIGKFSTSPSISVQPQQGYLYEATAKTATFALSGRNVDLSALNLEWIGPHSGLTESLSTDGKILTVTTDATVKQGTYSLTVTATGTDGTQVSKTVTVTVLGAPITVSTQPKDASASCKRGDLDSWQGDKKIQVTATRAEGLTEDITYQWKLEDDTPLDGFTQPTLSLKDLYSGNKLTPVAGQSWLSSAKVYCTLTVGSYSVKTNAVTLTVNTCAHDRAKPDGTCQNCGEPCSSEPLLVREDGIYYAVQDTSGIGAANVGVNLVVGGTFYLTKDVIHRSLDATYTPAGNKDVILDLQDHTLESLKMGNFPVGSITLKNGTLNQCVYSDATEGKLILDGVTFMAAYATNNSSLDITVQGKSVFKEKVSFSVVEGVVHLRGGTFEKGIDTSNGAQPLKLLADGYAFKSDRGIVDASIPENLSGEIQVVAHTCDYVNGKCECGRTCDHVKVDDNGYCTFCHALVEAYAIGEVRYTSLEEVLTAANAGDTITLRGDFYQGSKTVEINKSVTLNLGDHTLTGDADGEPVLLILAENVTIQNGTVQNTRTAKSSPAVTVGETGAAAEAGLTVKSVTFIGSSDGNAPQQYALNIYNGHAKVESGIFNGGIFAQGNLTMTGGSGTKLKLGYVMGTVELSGGSFDCIRFNANADYARLLADGYAYQSGTSLVTLENMNDSTAVQIVKCTHPDGLTADTACPYCGKKCGHENINQTTGLCPECGYQMAASLTVDGKTTFFDTFPNAAAAANGKTGALLTLLKDEVVQNSISSSFGGGKITIDWKGHTLFGQPNRWNSVIALDGAAELTLRDSSGNNAGGIDNRNTEAILVRGGSLTIESGTYASQVLIPVDTATVKISGGIFKNDVSSSCDYAIDTEDGRYLAELMAPGYTLALDSKGEELIDMYTSKATPEHTTVYVVPHASHTFDESGKCACGATAPVQVEAGTGSSYFGDFESAVNQAKTLSGSTVRLLEDVTHSGDSGIYIDSGIFTIDWNGHTLSGETSNVLLCITDAAKVTLTDSVGTGGYVDSLTAMEGSTVSLSGGSFGKIVGSGVTLKELLAEDCYYAELDGETPKSYADTDTVIEQVSVALCDHTSVRENKGTHFTTYTCNCGKVTYLLTVTVGESDKKYFGDYNTGFAYAAKNNGVVRFLELNGTIEVNAQGMVTIDMENRSYSAYGRSLVIKSGSTVKLVGQGAVMYKPEAGGGSGSSGTREYGEFIPVTVESGGTFVLPANNLNGEPNMAKPTQLTVQSGGTAELQGGSTQWTDVYGTLKISGGSHLYIHQYEMGQLNITGGQIQLLQIYGDLPQNALSGGSYVTISVMEFRSGETEKFRDVTFADFQKMLVSGKVFQKKQDQSYPNEVEETPNYGTFNYKKELNKVNVTAAPFTGVQAICQLGNTVHSGSVNTTYGVQEENFYLKAQLLSPAAEGQRVSYQWYQVQDGSKTEVGKDETYNLKQPLNVGVYTYQVTASCNGYELTSDPFTVTVGKAPQIAEVEAYDETVSGKNDGYVTLKPQISAYEMRKPGEETFTPCTGTGTKLPLSAGTYEIRMKETKNYNPTPAETVTIEAGPKLTVTLPSPQTGYTLTASKTQLDWHEDVVLTFQLNPVGAYKAADFGIWAEAGSEKTKLTLGNDGAVKLTAPEKDITITVTGVKTDNVAPQASIRGRLRKDSGYYVKWEGFRENPADDFVNGDFLITASDRGSGVASIWYCLSDKPLTLAEMDTASWVSAPLTGTNQAKVPITENGEYYLYVKALDKANNAGYACTGKLVKESNPPTFSGVENGKTYYVSQQMEIHDDGMPDWYRAEGSIGVVPNGGDENPIKLKLKNDGSSYTITAGDRCGNEASITVYMKPLTDLTQPLYSILEESIQKSDRATLDDVEATLKGLDVTYATEPEKKEINDALARIAELRQVLDQVAAVEAQIDALPDSVEPYQQTVEDTQIKPARQAYSDLTDHQKTLVDSTKLAKLGKLEDQLNAWTITEGDGQIWYKGSWNPLSFTVNGQTRKFSKVLLDGKMHITATPSFLAVSGSIDEPFTLTLKPEFLQVSMEPGEHTLTVIYGENNSGTGTVTFTVEIPANYLDVTGKPEFDGKTTVTVDGKEYPIEEMNGTRYVNLPETGDLLTIYSFKDGTPTGSYTNYPTGMQVFRITRQEGGAKAEEITEFANLLNYAGCSIRLTGTKGIRMITGISEDARTALTGARGLGGYTLEEYGTVVMRGVGTPTLENSKSHNFAYKKGKADPVFARVGGMIQYTNVLVGFSLEDCKDMLTLRPYIKLKDMTTGETVTLYGGCVSRSIGYIARQNANTYQPGTAGYKYVHEIIDAVYGKTEQGGETK